MPQSIKNQQFEKLQYCSGTYEIKLAEHFVFCIHCVGGLVAYIMGRYITISAENETKWLHQIHNVNAS